MLQSDFLGVFVLEPDAFSFLVREQGNCSGISTKTIGSMFTVVTARLQINSGAVRLWLESNADNKPGCILWVMAYKQQCFETYFEPTVQNA